MATLSLAPAFLRVRERKHIPRLFGPEEPRGPGIRMTPHLEKSRARLERIYRSISCLKEARKRSRSDLRKRMLRPITRKCGMLLRSTQR